MVFAVREPSDAGELAARGIEGAKSFYGAVIGWEILDLGGGAAWALTGYGDFLEERTPGTRANMASLGGPERFEDVVASVVDVPHDQADAPAHWDVTFAVDDVDAIAARATDLGGHVLVPLADGPWVRTTVISDSQGATLTASQFVPENKDLAQGASAPAGA